MARKDLVVKISEIQAVVVRCKKCGGEVHVPIETKNGRAPELRGSPIDLPPECPSCGADLSYPEGQFIGGPAPGGPFRTQFIIWLTKAKQSDTLEFRFPCPAP